MPRRRGCLARGGPLEWCLGSYGHSGAFVVSSIPIGELAETRPGFSYRKLEDMTSIGMYPLDFKYGNGNLRLSRKIIQNKWVGFGC